MFLTDVMQTAGNSCRTATTLHSIRWYNVTFNYDVSHRYSDWKLRVEEETLRISDAFADYRDGRQPEEFLAQSRDRKTFARQYIIFVSEPSLFF